MQNKLTHWGWGEGGGTYIRGSAPASYMLVLISRGLHLLMMAGAGQTGNHFCMSLGTGVLLVYTHDNVETYGGRRVALFGSVTLVAQVLKMVCSKCQKWRDGEWLVWRRCDSWEHGWVPSCMHSFHFWQGLLWFFYCQRCRDTDPTLGSKYINADGNWSTDTESEVETKSSCEHPWGMASAHRAKWKWLVELDQHWTLIV